jgi:hypothetical protein
MYENALAAPRCPMCGALYEDRCRRCGRCAECMGGLTPAGYCVRCINEGAHEHICRPGCGRSYFHDNGACNDTYERQCTWCVNGEEGP